MKYLIKMQTTSHNIFKDTSRFPKDRRTLPGLTWLLQHSEFIFVKKNTFVLETSKNSKGKLYHFCTVGSFKENG